MLCGAVGVGRGSWWLCIVVSVGAQDLSLDCTGMLRRRNQVGYLIEIWLSLLGLSMLSIFPCDNQDFAPHTDDNAVRRITKYSFGAGS